MLDVSKLTLQTVTFHHAEILIYDTEYLQPSLLVARHRVPWVNKRTITYLVHLQNSELQSTCRWLRISRAGQGLDSYGRAMSGREFSHRGGEAIDQI